jgi:putative ABC transport system substrate-binding protein
MWAAVASAQRSSGRPRIALLNSGNPEPFSTQFTDALRAEGYQAGRNVQIDLRSDRGKPERLDELAAELIRLKPNVIVANPTPAVVAAKRATSTIPIVMAPAGDPVGTGLVVSLARPGGNVTGVSFASGEATAKCVEIIKEALPSARYIAILANPHDDFAKTFVEQGVKAASTLGLDTRTVMIDKVEEIESAFTELQKRRPDFLLVQPSLPANAIVEHARRAKLPNISPSAAHARRGGLMGYSGNFGEAYRAAAGYVAKILNGAKPADLPVQLPARYDFLINMKVAKDIGFSVPRVLLVRAEVLD